MPTVHHDLAGLEKAKAVVKFCQEVSRPPCAVNLHYYGLKKQKTDAEDNILLGIASKGLEIYEVRTVPIML